MIGTIIMDFVKLEKWTIVVEWNWAYAEMVEPRKVVCDSETCL